MSLEQLAYVSEIVAAAAILVSIVFLVIEVRRNTNETKRQSTEDATSHRSNFVRMIAADGELAELLGEGLTGQGLSSSQWFRFNMFLYAIFVEFELNQRKFQSGGMDRDLWDAWLDAYCWWLQFPGVRKWWSLKPAGFTSQFREFVDRKISSIPVAEQSLLNEASETRSMGPRARSLSEPG